MNKLNIFGIIASGVLMWFLPGYALEQANRLEQEATGGDLEIIVPRPGFDKAAVSHKAVKQEPKPESNSVSIKRASPREIDDIPIPDIVRIPNPDGGPDIHVPASPENRRKQRNAGIYRNVSNVTQDMWWYLPAGLAVLLVLSKTTNLFQRRAEGVTENDLSESTGGDAAHIREMEKLVLLLELEKLRQATPALPEAGKEVQDEIGKPDP